ncbi:hypothetical protein JCM15519_25640 [Fundidesulfovibrio butyratiphilus]
MVVRNEASSAWKRVSHGLFAVWLYVAMAYAVFFCFLAEPAARVRERVRKDSRRLHLKALQFRYKFSFHG